MITRAIHLSSKLRPIAYRSVTEMVFTQEMQRVAKLRILGHNCVTLNACSCFPAVNKYLDTETKEKYFMYRRNKRATHEYTSFLSKIHASASALPMKRPSSIINEPKPGVLIFTLFHCETAGAIVLLV